MLRRSELVLAAIVLAAVAACGGAGNPASTHSAQHPSATPSPAAPKAGDCRNLTYADALGSSDETPTIDCTQSHSAVTVAVGPLVDPAHLQATDINDPSVQHELAVSCPKAVRAYAGGTDNTFDLSTIEALWFIPTPAEIAKGANWYRCDLVVLSGPNQLAAIPASMQNALANPSALNQWGTCGNTAPSDKAFQRQLCSAPHSWRAVSIAQLPPTAIYLDQTATANAGNDCRKVATAAANGALKFTWSFEWPNEQAWQAGQRYGLCWLPTAS